MRTLQQPSMGTGIRVGEEGAEAVGGPVVCGSLIDEKQQQRDDDRAPSPPHGAGLERAVTGGRAQRPEGQGRSSWLLCWKTLGLAPEVARARAGRQTLRDGPCASRACCHARFWVVSLRVVFSHAPSDPHARAANSPARRTRRRSAM